MTLSFLEASTILINLLALSIATGWIFTLLIQPSRDVSSYTFVAFCLSVAAWSFVSLLRLVQTIGINVDDVTLLQFQVTAMAFTVAAFYLFLIFFLEPKGQIASWLTLASPVVVIVAIGVIWLTDAIQIDTEGAIAVGPSSAFLFVGSLGYLFIGFWIILSSANKVSNLLLGPAILLLVAYGTNILDALRRTPLDMFLITVSIMWAGWTLLRAQVFTPMEQLNQELRTTNRGLQQVINDLAEERDKTEELNQELVAANRYKSEFLANISHELRTPLNSIIGYSELLHSGVYGQMSEKQQDRIEKIYRNGMTLLDLISDILDLNKIDAGKMKLDVGEYDLRGIAQGLGDEYQPKAEDKGLTYQCDIPEELPRLYGDSQRIKQVIENLLDNAVKFTQAGEISLTLLDTTVHNGKADQFMLPTLGWLSDGRWVIIKVADTGIGVPPEHQGRIFDEFSQVDGSHTREYGGTGLGLAICKRLVEMHSGTIWLNSAPGQGSRFYVALPADFKPKHVQQAIAE
jgi:signal transduction histidine kinase